ncbi:MAG: hypothetical protein GWN84_05260 [Gammaproteobacteria bacterium]|nr:hypothetical protein [Gammaproteobacteria bacterium]NIR82370.1 hypothetical protein [Gammaproteobacteria bacterium]NIU03515.1 hypothetical protein [Gammaproteobacteria bacterium]NIX84789.1 hypothetical protein [Gammaproteobacteria bacterium]
MRQKLTHVTLHMNEIGAFHVAPTDQGQTVEYAHATHPDYVVVRITDRSDHTVTYYAVSLDDIEGEIEPWNYAPQYEPEDMLPAELSGGGAKLRVAI